MTRVITKIGDIFSVVLDDKREKYFQYLANDLTQLNCDVIRVFKAIYSIDEKPNFSDLIKGEVDFYAHCVIKWGVKRNLWGKVGSNKEVGSIDVIFRGTNDFGHKVGEEPVKISDNWYIWKINDEKFTRVGKLEGKNQTAEIGLVVNPIDIVNRIKTGSYNFAYPGY